MKSIPSTTQYHSNYPVPPTWGSSDYIKAYATSWTFSCINSIAEKVSDIKLKLYQVKGTEYVEVGEHEALSILNKINKFTTLTDFIGLYQTYMELLGESVIAKLRNNRGEIVELWHLRPDWISIVPSETEYISAYDYQPPTLGEPIRFEAKDIIFIKNPNPANMYRGLGVVQAGSIAIDTDINASKWSESFFYNSALPSIVFTTDKNIKKKDAERFVKEWTSKFKGMDNSQKVAFLGGGLKHEKVSYSVADTQLLEMRRQLRDEILATFRVPKSIIGVTDDVNKANADATINSFINNVIVPKMRKFVNGLNEFYLPEFGDDLFFDFEDPTPNDLEANLKIIDNGLKYGWLTVNEAREIQGYDPVEGGDTIARPFGYTDVNGQIQVNEIKFLNTSPVKHKFMIKPPVRDAKDIKRDKTRMAVKESIKGDISKIVKSLITEDKLYSGRNRQDRLKIWTKLMEVTSSYEAQMEDILNRLFANQESRVLDNIEARKYWKKELRKGIVEDMTLSMASELEIFASALVPFISRIIRGQGDDVLRSVGIAISFNLDSKDTQSYLKRFATSMIRDINQTTANNLKDELVAGTELGESTNQLAQRVRGVFNQATESRSKTIARTEVSRAVNFANKEAYFQSGVVDGEEWITAGDERVRDAHMMADGQIVKLGESFRVGGEFLDYPGDMSGSPENTINCRCTTVPVVVYKNNSYKKVLNKIEEIEALEDINKLKKEVEELKSTKDVVIEESKKEAEKVSEEEKLKAKAEAEEVVNQAKEKESKLLDKANETASEIVARAKEQAEKDRVELLKGLIDEE